MGGAAVGITDAMEEDVGNKRILRVMDPNLGDFKLVWDPDNADEVALARKSFDDAKKKGMAIYRVKKTGEKADVVTAFDEDAKALICAPMVQGG